MEELRRLETHRPRYVDQVLGLELDAAGEETAQVAGAQAQLPLDVAIRDAEDPHRGPQDRDQPLDFWIHFPGLYAGDPPAHNAASGEFRLTMPHI